MGWGHVGITCPWHRDTQVSQWYRRMGASPWHRDIMVSQGHMGGQGTETGCITSSSLLLPERKG